MFSGPSFRCTVSKFDWRRRVRDSVDASEQTRRNGRYRAGLDADPVFVPLELVPCPGVIAVQPRQQVIAIGDVARRQVVDVPCGTVEETSVWDAEKLACRIERPRLAPAAPEEGLCIVDYNPVLMTLGLAIGDRPQHPK